MVDPADPDTAISRYERHVIPFNYGSVNYRLVNPARLASQVP